MIKIITTIILIVLVSIEVQASSIKKVDIYTGCKDKVSTDFNVPITVHHLGCDKALTAKLNSLVDSSTTKKEMARVSQEFISSHKEQYAEAFEDKAQMVSQKVSKYPAVVFNDKYVVYGTSDYEVAKNKYYDYKG